MPDVPLRALASAIETDSREIIAWVSASVSGISGEIIRDMMLDCVERRFAAIRAPQPVHWLAENGSVYTAANTVDLIFALNLVPCFTSVRRLESSSVSEVFVKTLKRYYAFVTPRSDAISILQQIPAWFED